MRKNLSWIALAALFVASAAIAAAQVKNYTPVTDAMLLNPPPEDWLMFSRTYDAQRYSPLKQITRQNAGQLGLAWSRGLGAGTMEGIPLVHNGVMYIMAPGAIQAVDATNGDILWEYKHKMTNGQANGQNGRSKAIAIYQDLILYMAPDATVVGIDAKTGALRWSAPDPRGHTSGGIVIDGKWITGGTCTGGLRANCYIAAYDAMTGKELWKFYTAQGVNDVNPDTWGGAPEEKRTTSTWGLPGTYDPVTNGHVEVISRAARIFDRVVVGVVGNPHHKSPMFSVEERVDFLKDALAGVVENVEIDIFSELVVEFARRWEATVIVKGLRVLSDFEWEFQMNQLNRHLAPEIETVYVMASPQVSFVSSSGVKEIASFGGNVEELVPKAVAARLKEMFPNGRGGAPLSDQE